MNGKTGIIFPITALILCGLPGMLSCLGGFLIAGFGLLSDKSQLKLDANLDQSSVLFTGAGGICLGLILVAIPILVWIFTIRNKPV